MKSIIFMFIMIYFHSFSQSADENIRRERKFGMELSALGPTSISSINLNYYLNHNFNLEIGGGLVGFYGGAKFFYGRKEKRMHWAPYLGAFYTRIYSLSLNSSASYQEGVYVPLGIQFLGDKGFTFGAEAAYIFIENGPPIWGALRIGYHF